MLSWFFTLLFLGPKITNGFTTAAWFIPLSPLVAYPSPFLQRDSYCYLCLGFLKILLCSSDDLLLSDNSLRISSSKRFLNFCSVLPVTSYLFFFLYRRKYSPWRKCQSNYFLLRQLYLWITKALIENQAVATARRYGDVAEKREVWGQQVPEREAWVQNRQWIHQLKLILVELDEEKSPGEGRARAWDLFFL